MSPVQSQEHNPLPEHPPAAELRARVERGGAAKYHEANAGKGKLFARERVALWQLFPLLVHAILFGGSYGSAVRRAAERYG